MSFPILKAPFPWFGGKSRVAHVVWERFGDVANYVEPFAGSLAVLLGRPTPARTETVNDLDCYLANFWRATTIDPEAVADFADWPVNEADLHARHLWLVKNEEFRERMKSEPDFYDARVAGWWVWGLCQWIGSGWCSRPEWTGRTNAARKNRGVLVDQKRPMIHAGHTGKGIHQRPPHQIPDMSGSRGVHRKLPSLGDDGRGVIRENPEHLPYLSSAGQGITNKRPLLGGNGHGVGVHSDRANELLGYFEELHARLRRVRVCCGDWARLTGPSVTQKHGVSGIFLDPPYDMRVVSDASTGRDGAAPSDGLYAHHSNDVTHEVRAWAKENGDNPLLRIALCGYFEEHAPHMPETWECVRWKAVGGYANRNEDNPNAERERIWFSPHCLRPQETFRFEEMLVL